MEPWGYTTVESPNSCHLVTALSPQGCGHVVRSCAGGRLINYELMESLHVNAKLQSQILAVAVLMSVGQAHAAVDSTELAFYASKGTAGSVFFDLGVTMSQFTPAAMSTPGLTITWDLVDGTVSSSTPGATTGFDYGSVWSGFGFSGTTRWGVVGADGNTPLGNLVSTTSSEEALVTGTSGNAADAASVVGELYNIQVNATGTHASADHGASSNTGLGGDVFANSFGVNDRWGNQTAFVSGLQGNGSMPFFFVDGQTASASTVVKYAGTFTLDASAGTLTYAVPVPEADTYALMGLGLGVLALASRTRRRTAQVA